MKKLRSIYKSDMFHAVLYKTFSRLVISACLCLLWQRFVSDGRFTIWEAPCFAVGAALLGWAWVSYLRLDGVRVPFLDKQKGLGEARGARKRHATHSMADFADEKIVSFDELSSEEKALCSMLASLIVGVPMPAIGIAASIL